MKDYRISVLADLYGAMLTEKNLEILRSYLDDDLSLSEIAADLGISRQAVSESLSKSKDTLLDMEQKLCVRQKSALGQETIERIETRLKSIGVDDRQIYDSLDSLKQLF